jgi:adenosylcobinamide kinase / adenosylcobinamide-phosphate guanylyltransferase
MNSPTPAVRPEALSNQPLARVTLVLGGARSGKSRFAEALLARHAGRRIYVATAEALDAEMAERIRRHRDRRGPCWETLEAPLDLPGVLAAAGDGAVLVDCLTLWLSNLMGAGRDIAAATTALLDALALRRAPTVLVSNEVGGGIVPDNALARDFRDAAGLMHQAVAEVADRVVLMVAGLPLLVKDSPVESASQ